MAKQLRLDVAQLTDVGRKREHNEDNMAYVIPKDPQVMAKKGALFIVADGMGGHAAGEVASEIAVDTVSNVYYQDDSDDAAASLLHAIKRANSSIHQRAAENMLRSGMGTTCVASVLRGNIAYVANVGDSRAYLIHNNTVKQVSLDHSWVAEQVRAGLLTEEQARTHTQRNVITRSLGTQPEVEVDIFTELLEEGDTLVLCTDGLSGLVDDDELGRIVHDFVPQESVYHLVERANENGGPDNITAIVIRVNEVGAEETPSGIRRAGPSTNAPSPITGTVEAPAAVGIQTAAPYSLQNSVGSSPVTGPLLGKNGSVSNTLNQPIAAAPPPHKKRNRLLLPSLAMLSIALIVALAGAGYYIWFAARPSIDNSFQSAQALVQKANNEVAKDPTTALKDLATAQTTLKSLQNNPLSPEQRTNVENLLQNDVTRTTRAAITQYNQMALINYLPCTNTNGNPINEATTNTLPKSILTVPQGETSLLFTVTQNGALYQVSNNNSLTKKIQFPNNAQVVSAVSTNKVLVALLKSGSNYSLATLQPGQDKADKDDQINLTAIKTGHVPSSITAWENDVYVVLTSANEANTVKVLNYTADKLANQPDPVEIQVSASLMSTSAFPNHQMFFLLSDGSMQNAQITGTKAISSAVLVQRPIAAPLPISSKDFSATMAPVPTAASTTTNSATSTPLAVAAPVSLTAGAINGTPHLFVGDATNHSVLDLQTANEATANTVVGTVVANTPAAPKNSMLHLNQQYASSHLLSQMKSVAIDPNGKIVYVLTQNGAVQLISTPTGALNNCA